MTTETTRQRHGDTMAVVTVGLESAVIDWQEILDCIKVEPDDYLEAPWDNCDGFNHQLVPVDGPGEDGFAAFIHDRRWVAVDLEYDTDLFNWYRERGASKGVAEQLTRQSMHKRIEQLIEWHQNGWEWWCVRGEMHGYQASVGGVDDYHYADTECKIDIAHELVGQLVILGYEIAGAPDAVRASKSECQRNLQRNLNLFNMQGG